MFVRKTIISFSIIIGVLIIPLMYYRQMFQSDFFVPSEILYNHLASYTAWDEFKSLFDHILHSTDSFVIGTEEFVQFENSWFFGGLVDVANLLFRFFDPILDIISIFAALIRFIIDTAIWVFEFFAILASDTFVLFATNII